MIGKGYRKPEVVEAMKRHGVPYLAAVGGAGALISQRIKKYTVLAYPDLGPEAVAALEVEDFPAIVVIDSTRRQLLRDRSGPLQEALMDDEGKRTPLTDAQRGPLPPRPHPSPNAFHYGG